jgi:hypothetical protein
MGSGSRSCDYKAAEWNCRKASQERRGGFSKAMYFALALVMLCHASDAPIKRIRKK